MTELSFTTPKQILTVSELNRLTRELLEQAFPLFWVSGEISNLTRAASGHWYFSLKDASAQVKCVMFKGRNSYVDFTPREGDKIEARCTVTLYEARGDFQLTVEYVQRAGLGALFEAYEKLKNKLSAEGFFDAAYKQEIPKNPSTIGIITSPDAAALHDVLTTLKRRNPNVKVIIYPSPVQGKGAAELLAKAIRTANQREEVDTLIICRGGGSLEDLWQFNEEIVARAIDDSAIPIISGVGHETDFTICDFVADVRAATPTAAAELATPSRDALLNALKQCAIQLAKNMQLALNQQAQSLDYLSRRLSSPTQLIAQHHHTLLQLSHRLNIATQQQLQHKQQQLNALQQNLTHLNPQAVLTRGYAFVHNQLGMMISASEQLHLGDEITLTLGHGTANANITKIIS
ncbi:MAG: exodeoxyribonuclease VII large subunit [Methylotenera sp.]|nr:exodeoxyribonuclease VII large subunit [Methylotenera sp.]